jgi:hypothetical protein
MAKKLHRWRIYSLGPAAVVGTVEAPDAKAAIQAAVEQFGITDPERQERLLAVRTNERLEGAG